MPQHKQKQHSDRLRTRNPGHALKRNAGKTRKGGSGWINPKSEQGKRKAHVGFLKAIPKITRDTESIAAGKLAMTGGRFRLKGMQNTAKEQMRLLRHAAKQKEIVYKNSNHKRGTTRRDDIDDEEVDFVFKSMGVVRDPEMEAIRAKKRAQRRGAAAGEMGNEGQTALLGQSAMDELDKVLESGAKPKGVASPGAGLLPASALDDEIGMGAEGTAALLDRVERKMRAEAAKAGAKSSTAVALAAELEAEQQKRQRAEAERDGTGKGKGAAATRSRGAAAGGRSARRGQQAMAGSGPAGVVDQTAEGGSAFSFGF